MLFYSFEHNLNTQDIAIHFCMTYKWKLVKLPYVFDGRDIAEDGGGGGVGWGDTDLIIGSHTSVLK